MDKLKEILSGWVGWSSLVGILLLMVAALSEKARKFLVQVLADYVAAHWRQFWYWASNRVFLASGYVKYTFAAGMSADPKLTGKFESWLREKSSAQVVGGNLRDGVINLEMRDMRNMKLELCVVTGQLLSEMHSVGAVGPSTDEGKPDPELARTELNIKWDKVTLRYRELRGTLDGLRQLVEGTRDAFAAVVEDKVPERNIAHLSILFRRDCVVDRSIRQEIQVAGGKVSLTRIKGETDFGAPTLSAIVPLLPSYLLRETLGDLMKKHNLTP